MPNPLTIPRCVAWQVAWGQAARGGVRWDSVWFATVRQVRHGPARYDAVGSGSGVVGYGKAGAAWIVVVCSRSVRYGGLRQVRRGSAG
jgi:hypothetical protein